MVQGDVSASSVSGSLFGDYAAAVIIFLQENKNFSIYKQEPFTRLCYQVICETGLWSP